MKALRILLLLLVPIVFPACLRHPGGQSSTIALQDAIYSTALAMNQAEQKILDEGLNTFDLYPTEAEVTFVLSDFNSETQDLGVGLAPGTVVSALSGGWTGTVSETSESTMRIKFTSRAEK